MTGRLAAYEDMRQVECVEVYIEVCVKVCVEEYASTANTHTKHLLPIIRGDPLIILVVFFSMICLDSY